MIKARLPNANRCARDRAPTVQVGRLFSREKVPKNWSMLTLPPKLLLKSSTSSFRVVNDWSVRLLYILVFAVRKSRLVFRKYARNGDAVGLGERFGKVPVL